MKKIGLNESVERKLESINTTYLLYKTLEKDIIIKVNSIVKTFYEELLQIQIPEKYSIGNTYYRRYRII